MKYKVVLKSIGTVLCIEAASMVPSLIVALINHEKAAVAFVFSIALAAAAGFSLMRIKTPVSRIFTRDGFASSLSWILVTLFGTRLLLSGASVLHRCDFETASGFNCRLEHPDRRRSHAEKHPFLEKHHPLAGRHGNPCADDCHPAVGQRHLD